MTAQVMQPSRRGFLRLLGGALAAPAIVRVASLMPISALAEPFEFSGFYSLIPLGQLPTQTTMLNGIELVFDAFCPIDEGYFIAIPRENKGAIIHGIGALA